MSDAVTFLGQRKVILLLFVFRSLWVNLINVGPFSDTSNLLLRLFLSSEPSAHYMCVEERLSYIIPACDKLLMSFPRLINYFEACCKTSSLATRRRHINKRFLFTESPASPSHSGFFGLLTRSSAYPSHPGILGLLIGSYALVLSLLIGSRAFPSQPGILGLLSVSTR